MAGRRARALGPALGAGAFLAYFDRYLPAAGATLLKHELALSDAAFGLAAASLFAIAYAGASVAAGLLPDAMRRWTIAAGIALWTAGSAALAFVSSFAQFALAEIAIGIGQACVLPAAVTALASAGGAARIGRSTSAFTIGSTLGRSSSVLVAGLLIGWLAGAAAGVIDPAWRAVFLLTAIPNLILLGWIVLHGQAIGGAAAEGGSPGNALRQAQGERVEHDAARLPWRRFTALFAAASAAVLVLQAIGVWFPTLLVRAHGLTAADAAVAAGAVTLVAAPAGQALGGRIVDRWPGLRAAPTGLVTGALAAACLGLWALVLAPGPTASLVLLGAIDLVLGIAALAALAGVQARTSGAARGRANGLFFAGVTATGYGLGPLVVGLLSDAGPLSATGLARAMALAATGAVVLAAAAHMLARGAR